ncbi:class I SAM-dependent methyltransferase [Flavobacterium glaciei]|uniref:Methyltransferase family protein n=1 Tax=Flavobacterium glaciei TaxID=386300 RepID=A0A562Q5Y5_9FLAO|nr:class I SAM-dependent methyltransferase [Flavobacterium glaciei]RDI58349.1 methyltransferase family protein [Flavobacterium glaciei]TWI52134.1 methyltransferase family protein [Flavobacterium glaciei]
MTWEETIRFIRTQPEYKYLVDKAYFEEDLILNVQRFMQSDEFRETLKLLNQYQPNAKTILDIGSGNGISAVALALEGYTVVSIEPDSSDTVGAGAIRKLKTHYNLDNLEVYEAFAEELQLPNDSFDIVYARQCMHHAYDLGKFVAEASRVTKKNGLFITIRDHVIFNKNDKEWFLENHPLQKFYGGENAFKPTEYKNAMENAGLEIKKEMKYYDSVINYFPSTKEEITNIFQLSKSKAITHLNNKIGILSKISFLQKLYLKKIGLNKKNFYDENKIPGRMYSYLCIKK